MWLESEKAMSRSLQILGKGYTVHFLEHELRQSGVGQSGVVKESPEVMVMKVGGRSCPG
jgi:hypothetical protein